MIDDAAVLAARAQVEASKLRLDTSVARAKSKLSPASMASDAVDTATEKAAQVAQSGLQMARERPGLAAAVAGAVALAFAHKPVFGWIGSLFGCDETSADTDTTIVKQRRARRPIKRT